MKRRSLLPLLILTLLVGLPVVRTEAGDTLLDDIEYAKQNVYPALVNISVVIRGFSGGRTRRFPAAGSGVIVSAAGHVLTNFHVAGETTQIHCTLLSGEVIEAEVVAHDPLTDLSVLKLKLATRKDATQPLPFATLEITKQLKVGEYVLAMGNPLTLSSSLTLGVVSNPNRVFTDFTGTEINELDLGSGEVTGIFTRWIQHDALILPGNSGGPLVNLRGKVVGINELGGGGVGFAIPSQLAAKVLNQVMTFGEVRRGWIGISVLPVSKLGQTRGALVSSIIPSSPADRSGIKAGDVLLSIDGQPTDVVFFEQVPVLYQQIAELPIDKEVRLSYLRNGEEKSCHLQVARMEKYLGEPAEYRSLGLTVRAVTAPMALARRFDSTDGVLVTGVRAGYPCADSKPPVRSGDVIRGVDGKDITDLASFAAAIDGFSDREEMVLSIARKEAHVLTVVKPREDPSKHKRSRELPKAWLGVKTQVLTPPVARALGVSDQKGFRVTQVLPWTQAQAAGFETGDLIVEFEGEQLDAYRTQDAQDLEREVEAFSIGDSVELVVRRDGERVTLKVTLEKTPPSGNESEVHEQKELEFHVRDIVYLDRVDHRWSQDQEGVLTTEVTRGGWANVAGLRTGDLIVRVGDHAITDVASFKTVMGTVKEQRPKVLPIFVHRGYRTHFVFLEPNWEQATK